MADDTSSSDKQRGLLLRKYRQEKGLNAIELAAAINKKFDNPIQSQAITAVERGQAKLRFELAEQCADILGVAIAAFSIREIDAEPHPMFPQSFKNKIGLTVVNSMRKACDQLELLFTDGSDSE